jgi:hypothetical protein
MLKYVLWIDLRLPSFTFLKRDSWATLMELWRGHCNTKYVSFHLKLCRKKQKWYLMPIPYPQLLLTCDRVCMILVNFVNFLIKTLREMFVTGFKRSYSYIEYEKINSCYFIFECTDVLLSWCHGFLYCENPQKSLKKNAIITHFRLCKRALSLQGSCWSIFLIKYSNIWLGG